MGPPQSSNQTGYSASAKSTGGGGFNHEDEVAGYYLAQMLAGACPFGSAGAIIAQIKFQTRADGWLLDDLLLKIRNADGTWRCAMSVKSNPQFTTDHAAPADFVHDCWEQLLRGPPMDTAGDRVALAVSGVPSPVLDDFQTLRGLAEASEPGSLEARLRVKGFADVGKRRMAASFACPADLAMAYPGPTVSDSASVIAKVFILDFDFPSPSSRSRREALQTCAQALHDGSPEAAGNLWGDLCALAREFRPKAGMLDLPRLVAHLRSRHDLAAYPDHRADWEQLRSYTATQLDVASRWTLAGRLSLTRMALHQKLAEPVAKAKSAGDQAIISILIGRSGDGKSVVARQWAASGSPLLWLDARLFEAAGGQNPASLAERRLNVRHALIELLPSAGGGKPRLVLDGVGRLFDDVALTAIAMLARETAKAGWAVVATCQNDDWERVGQVFRLVGLNSCIVQVEPLADLELREVSAAEPRLLRLLAKPHIRRVLARPKYLDMVLRSAAGDDAASISESEQWVGEAHIAEWCWRQLIEGVPLRTVRSAAAKQMASRQADAVRDSVAEDEIDAAHLGAIDELIADGICRKVGERLVFDHDLLGDWGRQRVLLSQPNIATFITSHNRGTSPLWLRSVRLWALDLLERQGDYAKWIAAVRGLSLVGEMAAADRVLEAAALSSNAGEHLEGIWSELSSDGKLCRRLFERFLRSATTPSPRAMLAIAKVANGAEKELSTWAAAEYRVPELVYWPAVLSFSDRHRNDVCRLAPAESARLSQLWLVSTSADFPFRKEAANIALAAAQNVHAVMNARKQRGYHSDKLNEWSLCHAAEPYAYATALIAATVLPTEVARFARQAAGRQDDSEAEVGERPGVVYAAPWPDGPFHRVSENFRRAVLSAETFLPLAAVAPDIASEVLLAVLIDPPELLQHPGMLGLSYDDNRELCIEHVLNWSPPFYSRGPFLQFLATASGVAIDAIILLVNFATERWVDRETRDVHQLRGGVAAPHPVRLDVFGPGNTSEWHGDADVYSWYLGDPRAPAPVTCALMALEKWLYDRIDQGDNITNELNQIKQNARSVAFAGLLSAVARYDPKLLKGPLAFLLGVPDFLDWDAFAKQDIARSAMFGWQLRPVREPHLVEQAQCWYAMAHRKTNLFTLAQFLLLNDAELRKIQTDRLPHWKKQLEGCAHPEQALAIERCLKVFDPNRWKVVDLPDGRKAWQQQQSPEEAAESRKALEEANDAMRVISFPHRCRELLDRSTPMEVDEREKFWAELKKVGEHIDVLQMNEPDSCEAGAPSINLPLETGLGAFRKRSVLDGTMGGIAVLLLRHRTWLDSDRSRKAWVLRQIRRIPRICLPKDEMESFHPDETNDDRWECFFAEIVVDFLCRKTGSLIWRFHAAVLTMGFHYSPIRCLFAAAYLRRAELDSSFEELLHLLLRWSSARWHAELHRNGFRINVDVGSEWQIALDAFLTGGLAGPLLSFPELAATPRELPDKPPLPDRFRRGLDVPVIAAALHSIMRPNEAHDEQERARWLSFWCDLLAWRLSPKKAAKEGTEEEDAGETGDDDEHARNKIPYRSDRWLLGRIADVLLQVRPTENHQQFWEPIFALVPALGSWTEEFLTSLFLAVLPIDPTPPTFSRTWKAMLDYASTSVRWEKADEDVWAHLLGFDHLLYGLWEKRHAPLIALAEPFLKEYVQTKMRWGSKLRELFGFLKTAAADEIRLSLLLVVADAVKERGELIRRGDDSSMTARFVDFCLHQHETTIRGSAELFAAVAQIVGSLVAVQEPLAFELQDKLRRS